MKPDSTPTDIGNKETSPKYPNKSINQLSNKTGIIV